MTDAPSAIGKYVMRPDEYLSSIIKVSEAYDGWLIGMLKQSKATIEMSWEKWPELRPYSKTLLDTCLCYVGIWLDRDCLFEFQMGRYLTRIDPRVKTEIASIVELLKGKDVSTLPPREVNHDQPPTTPSPSDEGLRRNIPSRISRRVRNNLRKRGRGSVPLKMPMGTRGPPGHR